MKIGRARLLQGAIGLLILAGSLWLWRGLKERLFAIPASGGEAFRLAPLATPHYRQRDPRWADEEVGGSRERLARVGCTVCSLAMALDPFGVKLTPRELNDALKTRNGFTLRGWLRWEVVTAASGDKVRMDYVGRPRHEVLDRTLRDGRPAIVKVYITGIIPHWVLVVGKEESEYLIRDPLGEEGKVAPLSAYGKIYALRTLKTVAPHR
jgi:hypothetical protein